MEYRFEFKGGEEKEIAPISRKLVRKHEATAEFTYMDVLTTIEMMRKELSDIEAKAESVRKNMADLEEQRDVINKALEIEKKNDEYIEWLKTDAGKASLEEAKKAQSDGK